MASMSRPRSETFIRGWTLRWLPIDPVTGARSTRATLSGSLAAIARARLTATVVVPTPPLGEKTTMRRRPSRRVELTTEVAGRSSFERRKRRSRASTRASSSRSSIGRTMTSSAPASSSRIRSSTPSLGLIARIGCSARAGMARMSRHTDATVRGAGTASTTMIWCSGAIRMPSSGSSTRVRKRLCWARTRATASLEASPIRRTRVSATAGRIHPALGDALQPFEEARRSRGILPGLPFGSASIRRHRGIPTGRSHPAVRRYELMLVFRPDAPDERIAAIVDRTTRQLTAAGGQIIKVAPWGRRRLAYPIERHREGSYHIVVFEAPPESIVELERGLLITEEVLRHLVVRQERPARSLRGGAAGADADEAPLPSAEDEEEDDGTERIDESESEAAPAAID